MSNKNRNTWMTALSPILEVFWLQIIENTHKEEKNMSVIAHYHTH